MAQGQRNNNHGTQAESFKPLAAMPADVWSKAVAAAGYTVDDNGNAMIPVSGDTGDGYLVSVSTPTDIDMGNLVRALLGHALRVGQAGVKASKSPSREVATASANSALNGGYAPQRDRNVDVAEREAERRFEVHVTAQARAVRPDASEDDIAATVKKMAESDAGKAWIANAKREVIANGTYSVSRKGAGKGDAIAITL
jgi:hypothetical protein